MDFLICLGFFLLVMGLVLFMIWGSKERSKQKLIDAGYTKDAAKELVDKTYRKAFWGF